MSSYTLKFPWALYERMRARQDRQRSTMRDLVREALRAEVEAAATFGEVGGPEFRGRIGQAPEDCSVGPMTGSPSRRRRAVVTHTFRFTTRFWRQIKSVANVRRVSIRRLAVDVLTRAMAQRAA